MKPVTQTIFGNGKGNCFAACIASILDLSIEDVPNFCGEYGDRWWEETQKWLATRGLFGIEFAIGGDPPWFSAVPEIPFIVTGQSPRGEFLHCVVAHVKDSAIVGVHDPHPDGTWIIGQPVAAMFFGLLFPASHGDSRQ